MAYFEMVFFKMPFSKWRVLPFKSEPIKRTSFTSLRRGSLVPAWPDGYTPGHQNIVPDAISRQEDLDDPSQSYGKHNERVILSEDHFLPHIMTLSYLSTLDRTS
ncbi:hypothetical protein DSO57_1038110 [Entomophthora muscae]|uniref:Uncharacterized protein n=1 Tax=Entomophthora muscae TaxID=34485 RepID=A0ACC2SYV2_9FUNG|nr:hypothetical protein DSO57_1038110 [Entomophthora muscae]